MSFILEDSTKRVNTLSLSPKKEKKTIFCWLPITSRSHQKRWDTIPKKKKNNDRHWYGKYTSKITGSFLQTEWYWNSNVELVHRKSWSGSRWWSLYNSREIKHKKTLALINGRRNVKKKKLIPNCLSNSRERWKMFKWKKWNPDLVEKVKKTKGENFFNIRGSVVNHIMWDLENQELITMCEYLEKFYGLMIYRKDFEGRLDDLFEGCINEIKNAIRVYLKILEKPMKKQFEIDLERKEMKELKKKQQEDILCIPKAEEK